MSRIPRHFHFIFGLSPQTEPFHILHYVCLESCLRVNWPERLTLYYHYEPYGRYWDLIKSRIERERVPLNEIVATTHYPSKLIGEKLRYAHHADFIRVEKLYEHGGVYADMDTIFIKPIPDELFEKSFVIGREAEVPNEKTGRHEASLCNALMLAEPRSKFARIWLERMPAALDGTWSNHSCQLAARICQEHPESVHAEPPSSFYPVMWMREDLRLLLEGKPRTWPRSYSVHLWAHLWWSPTRTDFSDVHHEMLTEHFLRKGDTALAALARPYLPPLAERADRELGLRLRLLFTAIVDLVRRAPSRCHRLAAMRWQLARPEVDNQEARSAVTIHGAFLPGSAIPVQLHATLGKRRIAGVINRPEPDGSTRFSVQFTTQPGLKWIALHATAESGAITPISRHLLRCAARNQLTH